MYGCRQWLAASQVIKRRTGARNGKQYQNEQNGIKKSHKKLAERGKYVDVDVESGKGVDKRIGCDGSRG